MASRSPPYLYAPWTAQKCQLPETLAIPVLRVAVRDSEIVITASDSDYAMTYHKPGPEILSCSASDAKTQAGAPYTALAISSVIFFASPSAIMVLSR